MNQGNVGNRYSAKGVVIDCWIEAGAQKQQLAPSCAERTGLKAHLWRRNKSTLINAV
jgi:hypothetical protein